MSSGYYDIAQICRNGHVINSSAKSYPHHNQKFCDKCGEPTVMECEKCSTAIRGKYHVPGEFGFSDFTVPAYCYSCGSPFPWTEFRLQVAEELADELEELTEAERESFKKSLPDVARETPRSELAQKRMKTILAKLGKDSYEAAKGILVEIASETTKKVLFGP